MTNLNFGKYLEVKEYCEDNSLDILDFLVKQNAFSQKNIKDTIKEKSPDEKKPIKSKSEENYVSKKPFEKYNVIDNVKKFLQNFIDIHMNSHEEISLEGLTKYIESTLISSSKIKKSEILSQINTPLSGLIGKIIYDEAESKKYEKKLKEKRYLNPKLEYVRPSEINNFLDISFDEESRKQMAGFLTPEYVRENYEINEGFIKLKNGSKVSVEGVPVWNGTGKTQVREQFIDFINEHLIQERKSERDRILEDLKKLEEEKLIILNSGTKVIFEGYNLKYRDKGGLGSLTNSSEYQELNQIPGLEINPNLKNSTLEIKLRDPNDNKLLNKLNEIVENLKNNKKSRIRDFNAKKIKTNIKNNSNEKEGEINNQIESLQKKLGKSTQNFNYLTLEGPGFGSYLKVENSMKLNNFTISATIPEYKYRETNLMRSISKAFPEHFENAEIFHKDINDFLLLDFVKNPRINLKRGRGGYKVYYGEEGIIFLEDYQELIKKMESKYDFNKLSETYNVPKEFVEALDKKNKDKMDIVFLDYYSGDHFKREDARQSLTSRLSDKSIFAITTNISARVKGGKDFKQKAERILDNFLEGNEFYAKEILPIEYKDNKDPMYFLAFYLERKINN